MRELPPGWATDLAVLELTGSTVEDHEDHLVIRTPGNPGYHWGNCLFVTDDRTVDDGRRWVETFRAAFPDATWIAIGLGRMPEDASAWETLGVELEQSDVLTTSTMPRQSPLADGYRVRRFAGADWELSIDRAVAENEQTREEEPAGYERFVRRQADARRDLSGRDVAAFFGAFDEGRLVAELGIVQCGSTARYQAVGTDDAHRRRGLASHLLGVAAAWAADHGCNRWVIVTEAVNPAGRVYRAAGFEPDVGNVEAYRSPAG